MSISYLRQIEELESIAAQLKRDTELTRNLVGIATAERDSLVAQVVTLRKAVAEAKQVVGFLSHHLRGRMAEAAIIDMAEKADSWAVILNQSPTACLAQVRAEAVLEAVKFFHPSRDIDVEALESYAKRIRQGGEK